MPFKNMLNLKVDNLNNLELQIKDKLLEAAEHEPDIKITRAAQICGCSISKISKFVKKLGFSSYKEYMGFVYGKSLVKRDISSELARINDYIESFDLSIVDDFISLLNMYDKIVLFGYGPSLICAQYFEYKLRFLTSKIVMAVSDDDSVRNLLDSKCLFVILSTTGRFKSFSEIYHYAKKQGSCVIMIVEEYNTSLINDYDNIFFLTQSFQDKSLTPYEKTRTATFIFIEEVLARLIYSRRSPKEPIPFHIVNPIKM